MMARDKKNEGFHQKLGAWAGVVALVPTVIAVVISWIALPETSKTELLVWIGLKPAISEAESSANPISKISECDALAAHPYDAARPNQASPVDDERFNASDALAVCKSAFALDPANPRINFQLARAFHGVGEHASALRFLQNSIDKNYAAAMLMLGNRYWFGEGVSTG